MLAAEGPLPTLREWQAALGRAASLLPPWPLGPIHLEHDPGLTAAEFSDLLPDDVRDAWTSAMAPTQVEFTHIRDGFKPRTGVTSPNRGRTGPYPAASSTSSSIALPRES